MGRILNAVKDSVQRLRSIEDKQITSPLSPSDSFQFTIIKVTSAGADTSIGNKVYTGNPINPWNGVVSTETITNVVIPNQFSFYTGDWIVIAKATGQFLFGLNIGTYQTTENGYGLYVSSP